MPHIEQQNADKDKEYLKRALELAEMNLTRADGGPFGALIIKDDKVISEAWNTVIVGNDPTAHAEINAIRIACEKLKHFHLTGCTLYASSEPCPMCLSAAYWARVDRIVFANPRAKAASIGFSDEELYHELALPMEQRKIAMRQMAIDGASDVISKWMMSKGEMVY
jgi:tRNA(Arg) A34 adenosine deaminase TadA